MAIPFIILVVSGENYFQHYHHHLRCHWWYLVSILYAYIFFEVVNTRGILQPRICTIAREFSRLMGVDLHLEVVITSSSSGRCRSILLVYNTCVLRNRIPLFSGDFAVIKIGQILYQMWSFSYYNATLFNAHQLFAMLAFQAEVTRTESLVHFHTSPFLLQFYLFIYFSIIIIFISWLFCSFSSKFSSD